MAHLRTRDRGITILTALVAVIIIGGISSAFFLLSLNEAKSTEEIKYKARATYLAEAGSEIACNTLRQAIANSPAIMLDPTDPANIGATAFNTIVVNQTVTIDGFPVQCKAIKRQIIVPPNPVGVAAPLRVNHASFEVMGYARVGGNVAKAQDKKAQMAIVYKMVETNGTPLFQFLAFYNDDLEANPGPYAHFHGRMHTNADMYLTDRDTKRGMVIDTDHVQAVGKMYRTYSSRQSDGTFAASAVETGANGDIWVRQMGTTPLDDATIDAYPGNDPGLIKWDLGLNSDTTDWAKTATTNWNQTVMDGSMGAQTMVAPQIESIKPGGWYDTHSGLQIKDGVVMQNGVDVTSAINSAQPGAITTSSIYDAREEKDVPVVSVDVGKLSKTSYWPTNGILYATHSQATAAKPQAIQLTNGSYIPTGFTVATNLPVYVKGDYNGKTDDTTGLAMMVTDNSKNPPTRTMQTVNDAGTTVNTQACAILADAVNLLSNSWDNSKTASTGISKAKNTTYNTAILSGNQLTTYDKGMPDNGYNGGLQNLPRFHEDWGGINANIAGSFVNLWRSQIATGGYGKGNVYSPPVRHWDFDQKFDKTNPPGSPFVVSIGRTTYEEGAVRGNLTDAAGNFILDGAGNKQQYDLHPD